MSPEQPQKGSNHILKCLFGYMKVEGPETRIPFNSAWIWVLLSNSFSTVHGRGVGIAEFQDLWDLPQSSEFLNLPELSFRDPPGLYPQRPPGFVWPDPLNWYPQSPPSPHSFSSCWLPMSHPCSFPFPLEQKSTMFFQRKGDSGAVSSPLTCSQSFVPYKEHFSIETCAGKGRKRRKIPIQG